jgi:hypothetical protein
MPYFTGITSGEICYTKDFVVKVSCPEHESYWRINPAEAAVIGTGLKRDLQGYIFFFFPKSLDRLWGCQSPLGNEYQRLCFRALPWPELV